MGKLVVLLAVGSGTVTASVGGFYLLNRSGTGEDKRENSGQIQSDGVIQERKDVGSDNTATNALEDLKFKTLQEFKTNHGGDCAKRYFQDLDYGSAENSIGASNVISASDLQPSVAEDGHPKSCLVINWERSDSKDNSDSSNNK